MSAASLDALVCPTSARNSGCSLTVGGGSGGARLAQRGLCDVFVWSD
jgi:hypothetical protein